MDKKCKNNCKSVVKSSLYNGVNASVNSVNFTDGTYQDSGQVKYLEINEASKRECKLLLIGFTIILLLIATKNDIRVIISVSAYYLALFVHVDCFNLLMRLTAKSKNMISVSIIISDTAVLIVDYIGITTTIILCCVSIFLLAAVLRFNHIWMLQAKIEQSEDENKLVKRQRRKIESYEKKIEELKISLVVLQEKNENLKQTIEDLELQLDEVMQANTELVQEIEQVEQRADAIESYADEVKKNYDKINSATIPNVAELPEIKQNDDISIRDAKILQYLELGMSLRQIGQAVGCSQTTVANVRKKHKESA